MLWFYGLLEQRVVLEINHSDGKVVACPPIGVHGFYLLARQCFFHWNLRCVVTIVAARCVPFPCSGCGQIAFHRRRILAQGRRTVAFGPMMKGLLASSEIVGRSMPGVERFVL